MGAYRFLCKKRPLDFAKIALIKRDKVNQAMLLSMSDHIISR